jgi:hypothetical protein
MKELNKKLRESSKNSSSSKSGKLNKEEELLYSMKKMEMGI